MGGEPGVELCLGDGVGGKAHRRKTVSAEVGREAGVVAGVVGLEVEMRHHAGRGVDHAAELGDEEAVHDGGGGELEVDGDSDRDGELVHAGAVPVGVDEEPFPIERHDLDANRAGV